MGARPARDIVATRYDRERDDVLTTFAESYGGTSVDVALSDVPRPELSKLAGYYSTRYSNADPSDAIREAIRTSARNGASWHAAEPIPNTYTPEPYQVPQTGEPVPASPVVTPEPVTAHVTAQVDVKAQAVQDLLAIIAAGGSVNPDDIAALVDARMAGHRAEVDAIILARLADLNAPVVNHVHVPGTPEPVILAGRQHVCFPDVLVNAACRIHTYLVGPPGTGKSTIAQHAAEALGLEFSYIACFPTMPASNLWGFIDAGGTYHATEFRRRYETGGIFLFDEIDNGHAGTTASVNAAIANGHAAFPDGMVKRHPDFIVIAAANTWGNGATSGSIGRNALDGATLDRFDKVLVDVDEDLELDLAFAANPAQAKRWSSMVQRMRANALKHGIKVVISPRASIDGAKLIAAGRSERRTAEGRILSGLTPEQVSRVLEGVTFA